MNTKEAITFGPPPVEPVEFESLTPIQRRLVHAVTRRVDYTDSTFNNWQARRRANVVEDDVDVQFGLALMSYRQARLSGSTVHQHQLSHELNDILQLRDRMNDLHPFGYYIESPEGVQAGIKVVKEEIFTGKNLNYQFMNRVGEGAKQLKDQPVSNEPPKVFPHNIYLTTLIFYPSSDEFSQRYIEITQPEHQDTSHQN